MEQDFAYIVREQTAHYPQMTPQDYVKLAYQCEYGPAHLSLHEDDALAGILGELSALSGGGTPTRVERIGNMLARMPLAGLDADAAPLLAGLFVLTAHEHRGDDTAFAARLDVLRTANIAGMDDYLASYPGGPVHHSARYAALYRPHYRLLNKNYAVYFRALLAVERLLRRGKRVVVAIDGRCGSGKSTLGGIMQHVLGGNLYHMDDFYLPGAARPANWESIPAGNMDLTRFRDQVLVPAHRGETVYYSSYDNINDRRRDPVACPPAALTVIEGSYSQHPMLTPYYDLKIFLTCQRSIQNARLQRRESKSGFYDEFQRYWIPMEERYHDHFRVPENADLLLNTESFF